MYFCVLSSSVRCPDLLEFLPRHAKVSQSFNQIDRSSWIDSQKGAVAGKSPRQTQSMRRPLQHQDKPITHLNCFEKSSAASSSSQLSSHKCSFPPLAAVPAACSASSWGQSASAVSMLPNPFWNTLSVSWATNPPPGNLQTRHPLPALGAFVAAEAGRRGRPWFGLGWNWTW